MSGKEQMEEIKNVVEKHVKELDQMILERKKDMMKEADASIRNEYLEHIMGLTELRQSALEAMAKALLAIQKKYGI